MSLLDGLEGLEVPKKEGVRVIQGKEFGLMGDEGEETEGGIVGLGEEGLDSILAIQLDVAVE